MYLLLAVLTLLPPNKVTITERDGFRYIEANGIPNHVTGAFPNRGNPNTIAEQSYHFRMTLTPKRTERATAVGRYLFGVALNGVPFDPGTAELWNGDPNWRYQALSGKINLGIDQNTAHVQPGGAYHYHGLPNGLIAGHDHMNLVGYAADGFEVYDEHCGTPIKDMRSSWRLKQGERPDGPGGTYDGTFDQDFEWIKGHGDLDGCNGHTAPTPTHPEGVYHYHITETYPFISRWFRGTPDSSFQHKPPRGMRPPGPPPRQP